MMKPDDIIMANLMVSSSLTVPTDEELQQILRNIEITQPMTIQSPRQHEIQYYSFPGRPLVDWHSNSTSSSSSPHPVEGVKAAAAGPSKLSRFSTMQTSTESEAPPRTESQLSSSIPNGGGGPVRSRGRPRHSDDPQLATSMEQKQKLRQRQYAREYRKKQRNDYDELKQQNEELEQSMLNLNKKLDEYSAFIDTLTAQNQHLEKCNAELNNKLEQYSGRCAHCSMPRPSGGYSS